MIQPLHILHPPFWFILGGSLCEDLGFFHSFKTSPRSSKSESGCKSYACFNFGVPAVFLWAGCPGLGRMSGLPGRPGCPGYSRMSGRPRPETIPKCWLSPPDVRVPCFYSALCTRAVYISNARMSGPRPGCPARHSHLHSNGHICTHTINTSSPLHGEVDHSL